ncbi:chorismate mutase [Uliginosibacterium sp. sgz301328]|uniref:chorismate mutase n=1 Tax=Uliginosibacterium sp. sgz301328 TaxID=3243764 RepID=UPI00359E99D9
MSDTQDTALLRLAELRRGIDVLDAQLIGILGQRFGLTAEVGKLKKEHSLPPQDPAREAQQMARIAELATGAGLDPALAQRVFRAIIDTVVQNHKQV